MKVIAYGGEYECAYAEKTMDAIRMYDEQGNEIGTFGGISDFSAYTVQDGELLDISNAPTQLDQIEAQVTYTAMMTDTLLE